MEMHELQVAVDAVVNAGGNKAEAARELGIPRRTLGGRLEKAGHLGIAPKIHAPDVSTAMARQKLKSDMELRDLRRQLKEALKGQLTLERVREMISGVHEARAEGMPEWVLRDDARGGDTGCGVPCTSWSDWHWGEVVTPSCVDGLNTFNMEVGRERVRRLVERTIDLCFNHMVSPQYPGIVVNILGDMVSGNIHELEKSNEQPIMPVVIDVFQALAWAIDEIAEHFGNVFVVCVVGNHARNTQKPEYKNKVYENFDWLIYKMLETHFIGDPRIKFLIPDGADALYSVYGHKYLATHGDELGVRGGDGVIGILSPLLRGEVKIREQSARIDKNYDTLVTGHLHRYVPLPDVICNGSLKGYCELAMLKRWRYERPIQALWFTHPHYGVTASWPVYLDEQKQKKKEGVWLSWHDKAT